MNRLGFNKEMKKIIITLLVLTLSCSSSKEHLSYKIIFEYREVTRIDIKNKGLPDFRKLCNLNDKELESYCSVSLTIIDPNIPVLPEDNLIRNLFTKPYHRDSVPGELFFTQLAVEYNTIGKIFAEDTWELQVFIPKPGSKGSPSYIFTQPI